MQETRVRSLGREDPLEKEMATHSSTLAWKIPWMEEPGRLQSVGSQRVGHDWATSPYLTSEKIRHNWATFTSLQTANSVCLVEGSSSKLLLIHLSGGACSWPHRHLIKDSARYLGSPLWSFSFTNPPQFPVAVIAANSVFLFFRPARLSF